MIADIVVTSGLLYAMVPTALIGLFSLIAYLFRQNARSNEALARTAQELKDISRRTERLEEAVFFRGGNEPRAQQKTHRDPY